MLRDLFAGHVACRGTCARRTLVWPDHVCIHRLGR